MSEQVRRYDGQMMLGGTAISAGFKTGMVTGRDYDALHAEAEALRHRIEAADDWATGATMALRKKDDEIDALRTQVAELRAENGKLRQEQGERQEAVSTDALRQRFSEIEDEVARGKHNAMSCFTAMRTAALYTPQPGPDVRGLAAFALELIDGACEGGSFDGGDIQDAGVRHGLLAVEQRQESCGEHCDCAEYGFPSECYRLTPALAAHRQAQRQA